MPNAITPETDCLHTRQHPRLRVPAMYSLLRARLKGDKRYKWSGFVYDVSMGGMRFELDEALDAGTEVEVRAMLPGSEHTTFKATGRVIRMHDDELDIADGIGPVRMAMIFDKFVTENDETRVRSYLKSSGIALAA